MLCFLCKEQIEMGEACKSDNMTGHKRYFHVGCHRRFHEEAVAEDEAFKVIENRQKDLFQNK